MFARFLIASAALGLVVSAGASNAGKAEEFVTITEDTFFPPILFLRPGTDVTFVNTTDRIQAARAADGSWETGDIAPGAEVTIKYTPAIEANFENAADNTMSGAFINVRFSGEIEDPIGGNYDAMVVGF